jgi:diguanylate cyclase (GGDEF)-like protein
MKVSSARTDAFAAIRRRGLAEAGARAVGAVAATDSADFLGLSETELTPAVRAALSTLAMEIEGLRSEVQRLKARLLEAEAEADLDPLTGVKNRRAFVRELKRIAAFAQRYDAPASVAYFDVDELKAVNDRFGHATGDAALRAVAQQLSGHVRESDIVGRMGGDEFAVLLVQADLPVATAKAEMLARTIAAAPIQAGDWLAPVRVSWGVRQLDPAQDPEAQIAEADAAMFAMKRARGAAA